MQMGRPVVGLALAALLAAAPLAAAESGTAESSFNAGLVHLREGRARLAIEEFKKAAKEDPKNPYVQKGLGLAYAHERRYDEAIAALRRALELNPYYVDVRNDLGTVLVLAGRREEGKREFIAAFNDATNPTAELTAHNLGRAFLEERNYAEAGNWFRAATNRNKKYAEAYVGLAQALVGLGRAEEAIVNLEQGAKEAPDNGPLLLALGEAYQKAGRLSDARARFEEATRKDPVGAAGRRAAELLKDLPAR